MSEPKAKWSSQSIRSRDLILRWHTPERIIEPTLCHFTNPHADVHCSSWLAACAACNIAMTPSMSVYFVSLFTSCVGLQEEEPQTACPMSFTWASHIAASMHYGMCNFYLINNSQPKECYSMSPHSSEYRVTGVGQVFWYSTHDTEIDREHSKP